MPKLQHTKNGQFTVTIPHELVKAKKWKKGDLLAFAFNERGNLEITKVEE